MRLSDLAREHDIHDPRLDHPVFDRMDNVTRVGAMLAASRLMACADKGYDVLNARKIIDFGTGTGSSALTLGLLAKRSGGSVDSLEICSNLDWDEKIKHLDLARHLPVRVHGVDGLEWISNRAQEGKRYDLITGCWFAPDDVGDRTRGLLSASRQALASSGLLIVYSDLPTMDSVQRACDEESVGYDWIWGQQNRSKYEVNTILIRQPYLTTNQGVTSYGN